MNEATPVAADPRIGTIIAGYFAIRRKLSEGGMGAVYLAEHVDDENLKKVVKFLLPQFARVPEIRERFIREAKAATKVRNRYLITIDSFGDTGTGELFLMMPFLEGKTLEAHLRQRGRLSLHETFHIMVQVLRALSALHDAGIVHRDIKPSNIFLVHDDNNPYEVKVIDLGIAHDARARDQQHKTSTTAGMGTAGYMAVECYVNAASATPASDLYGCALIAWELLSGQLPWGMPNDPAVFFHLQMSVIPPPPPDGSISPELYQLFLRMIAIDPRARCQSAKEFAIAFASLVPAMPEAGLPSGAQIVERFARDFLRGSAALDATLRSNPDHNGAAPIVFPLRGTRPAPGDSGPAPAAPAPGTPQPMPVVSAPGSAPTVSARPGGSGHPHDTTLGSASGMMRSQAAPQPRRSGAAIAFIGIGVAAVAAAGVFFIARGHRHSSDVASAPTAPLDASVVAVHDAAPALVATAPADAASKPAPVAPGSSSAGSALPAVAPVTGSATATTPTAPIAHVGSDQAADAGAAPRPEHVVEHIEHHAATAVQGTGTLIVTFGGDSWATCYVDGRKIGSTPCHATLAAGSHRLRVVTVTPTKHEQAQTVTIGPNKQTVINETW